MEGKDIEGGLTTGKEICGMVGGVIIGEYPGVGYTTGGVTTGCTGETIGTVGTITSTES
jgi:hypothetical protein